MNKSIYENSIVLIGPVGVGKSVIASRLSKITGMPIVSTDLLRHCFSKDALKSHLEFLEFSIRTLHEVNPELRNDERTIEKLKRLKSQEKLLKEQFKLREMFPNLKSYEDYGYHDDLSRIMLKYYGEIGWHFYEKQFENKLLADIIAQLRKPCILELGGPVAISLDKQYDVIAEKMKIRNPALFKSGFKENNKGFSFIKECLLPFKNVILLTLPDDYKFKMMKASCDALNPHLLSSGQYDRLATKSICVESLFNEDNINNVVCDKICNKIIKASAKVSL